MDRKEGREEIVDSGVADKRLMIVEAEFASAAGGNGARGQYVIADYSARLGWRQAVHDDQELASARYWVAHLDHRPHHN
jgi:hypothetical protein